jgi:beta-xylosidase
VSDEKGRDFLLYHAYSRKGDIYTGRQALLDEVDWSAKDGWPRVGTKGPSVKAVSPMQAAQTHSELRVEDTFNGTELKPGWTWPQDLPPSATVNDGALTLGPKGDEAAKDEWLAGALARPLAVPDMVGTTTLRTASVKPGTSAGIAAISDRENATGLAVRDGKLVLWRRREKKDEELASVPLPKGGVLQLKVTVVNGSRYDFAWSSDGRKWTKVEGRGPQGEVPPPWDRAMRIGITVGRGSATFDDFTLQPSGTTQARR